MQEVTLFFEGGGFIVLKLSEPDAESLLELVDQYDMPINIKQTEWVHKVV